MSHKFTVGQVLDLLPVPHSNNRSGGPCRVLALLPFEGHQVQYRVQPESERTERIVSENDLRPSTAQMANDDNEQSGFKGIAVASRRA